MFPTNHARALILIVETPSIRRRDTAVRTRITERAAQRIVGDLEADGYLPHEEEERRNHDAVRPDARPRHPLETEIEFGEFIPNRRSSTKSRIVPDVSLEEASVDHWGSRPADAVARHC